jgi:hypothetical protein
MRVAATAAAVIAVSLFVLVPSAGAAPPLPTGAPGLNQYDEQLPGPRGDKSVTKIRPRDESNLPPGPAAALNREGQSGQVAAALAAATKPHRAHHRRHVARSGAVARVLDGSGGMGALFPILLALIVLTIALAVIVRRRLARPRTDPA